MSKFPVSGIGRTAVAGSDLQVSSAALKSRNRRFALALAGLGLAVPVSAVSAKTISFHDANQGYAYYGGYNVLMYGQGAASDLGNNIWNGFGMYGGPGSTDFFGSGNPDSAHGSVPSNSPGQPYAWHSGTSASGTSLFSPLNPGASNTGNVYSDGTISPITLSLSYNGDNGSIPGVTQGQPNFVFSHAALVSSALGTFSLGGVPSGSYDLYLYGSNYDGSGGGAFNVTSGTYTAVGGFTQAINAGGGTPNSYVLGVDYVEFTNISPTSAGVIAGTWGAVSNGNTGLSGEGDFNGLQLVSVLPTYIYTGTGSPTAGIFDNTSTNFVLNGSPTAFPGGAAGAAATALFDDSATGTHNVTVAAGGVSPGTVQFNNNNSSYTLTGGPIAGTGSVLLTGIGTVTFANSNTYTGGTAINSGTLIVAAGGSVASTSIGVGSTGTLTLSPASGNLHAGALTATSLTITDNGTINISGSNNLGALSGSGTVNLLVPGTLTLTGGSFSGSLVASGSILNLAGAGGTFAAPISNGGSANKVIVNSTGSWVLGANNSYTGGTTITAGTATGGSSQPFGTGPVVLAGGSLGASYAAPAAVVPGVVSGGSLTLANAGNGVLELSGANTFAGPVVIQGTSGTSLGGTLKIDSPGALGTTSSITVASGGSFEVNDNSGTAGVGVNLVISGTGATSANVSPLPNGPTGALRGGDNTTSTWAGNVNVSGASYISSGTDGTFILTGSISGNGPVTFDGSQVDTQTDTVILAPATGKSNTYTGETQFTSPNSNILFPQEPGALLQLGANNGISPNSGLNVIAGSTAQYVTVDLNGFNQSVQYLTGAAQVGYQITNNSGTPSTLTITSGLKGGSASSLGTPLTGNLSVVMNDPTGLGTQILSGSNSYTGTTTITKGTLSAGSSTAFSTANVTVNGGTLGLAAVVSGTSAAIITPASVNSFQKNNDAGDAATISNSVIQITDGTSSVANSVFAPTPVVVSDTLGFTAKFTYTIVSGNSDGIAFVLQNDPRGASAVSQSQSYEIGYGGTNQITKSAAIAFEIYPGNSHNNAGDGTAFTTGGFTPGETGSPATTYNSTGAVDLYTQANDVTLVYNGPAQTLTETIVGEGDGSTFTITYTGIDYSALVGGTGATTTAYLGFTGGSGGAAASQTISNVSYATNLTSPQSISNEIDASGGATSSIQIGITGANTTTGGTVGPINISSGSTVNVTVPSGVMPRGVLFTPSVTVVGTGKLDLGFNDLVVTASTLTQVNALVASGYAGGKWTGAGIASRAAANTSHLTALGVIINDNGLGTPLYGMGGTLSSTFDGSLPSVDNILVKYTYYGDTNLDGAVDGTDYSRIDSAFLADQAKPGSVTGWYNGDFNYDGAINGSDYTLIDNAFNQQGASLGSNPVSIIAAETAQVAGATSAVPEPTMLSLIGVTTFGLLSRRRRRN